MRKVQWWEDGVQRARVGRNDDTDEEITEFGIPNEPPDIVGRLDWMQLGKDVYNQLMRTGILTWQDVVRSPGQRGITSAILAVLRKPIIELYREKEAK